MSCCCGIDFLCQVVAIAEDVAILSAADSGALERGGEAAFACLADACRIDPNSVIEGPMHSVCFRDTARSVNALFLSILITNSLYVLLKILLNAYYSLMTTRSLSQLI